MSTQIPSPPASPETRHGLGPLSSNEIVIGLALGSPTGNSLPPLPYEYFNGYVAPSPVQDDSLELDYSNKVSRTSYSSPPPQPARADVSGSGLKRSGSKWKNLGSLFSRKAPPTPRTDDQPFYMLDRPNQQEWARPVHTPGSLEELAASQALHAPRTPSPPDPQSQTTCTAEPAQESGARALLRRASTRRRGIRKRARAQTASSLENSRRSPAKARLEDQEVSEERAGAPTWFRPDDRGDQKVPAGISSLPGISSLLQVEIPSVELERYSVMFGDLLLPKSARSPPLRPSPKQSQLRDLKPAASDKENEPQRRALSPLSSNPPLSSNLPRPPHTRRDSSSSTGSKSSIKSASYGLFPSPSPAYKRNAAQKSLPKPSPLSRSVTTPNVTAASPPRPKIQTSKSQDPNQLMIVIHKAEAPSPPRAESGSIAKGHHRRTSSFNPSDVSDSSTQANYFEYMDDFAENEYSRPSSANGPRREALARSAFPVRKSSMKAPRAPPVTPRTPSPQFSAKSPSPIEMPDAIGSDGEVSIARQVSISRRQGNLVPGMPQAVRQPMQVKLVNSSGTPARRKSHHLTIEDVVDKC